MMRSFRASSMGLALLLGGLPLAFAQPLSSSLQTFIPGKSPESELARHQLESSKLALQAAQEPRMSLQDLGFSTVHPAAPLPSQEHWNIQLGVVTPDTVTRHQAEIQFNRARLNIHQHLTNLASQHLSWWHQLRIELSTLAKITHELQHLEGSALSLASKVAAGQATNLELQQVNLQVLLKQQEWESAHQIAGDLRSKLEQSGLQATGSEPWISLPLPPVHAESVEVWQAKQHIAQAELELYQLQKSLFPGLSLAATYQGEFGMLGGSLNQHLEAGLTFTHQSNTTHPEAWKLSLSFRVQASPSSFQLLQSLQHTVDAARQFLEASRQQQKQQDQTRQQRLARLDHQVNLLSQLVDLSTHQLQVTQKRMQLGLVGRNELHDAELKRFDAIQNLYQAEFNRDSVALEAWKTSMFLPEEWAQ